MYNVISNEFVTIATRLEDHIQTIWIKRPENLNKLNVTCMEELRLAIQAADQNTDCKVMILTGFGEYFCGGGELGDYRTMSSKQIAHFGKTLSELISLIKSISTPVIAAVNGPALGGGLSLVEACDLAVSSVDATFGIPEITGGFCPAIALISVANVLNAKKTMEMALLGIPVSAQEALLAGLINWIAEKNLVLTVAHDIARQIASSNPSSISVTKQLFNKSKGHNIENQLQYATGSLVEFLKTLDAKEALDAKDENRLPIWNNQ
jgi:enoyl-CoA hydratase/carnithine racemase